jgi:hypothetical protein
MIQTGLKSKLPNDTSWQNAVLTENSSENFALASAVTGNQGPGPGDKKCPTPQELQNALDQKAARQDFLLKQIAEQALGQLSGDGHDKQYGIARI